MRTDKFVYGFDERLKQAIDNTGMTQREVEKRAGLNGKSNLYRYIVLHQMPNCFVLVRLATVLNVSTDWLLGIERSMN